MPPLNDQTIPSFKGTTLQTPNSIGQALQQAPAATAKGLGLIGSAIGTGVQAAGSAIGNAIVKTPYTPDLINVPQGMEPTANGLQKIGTSPPVPALTLADKAQTFTARGVQLGQNDLQTARNVLYGEVSNRSQEKRELEATTIMNTAINRLRENQNLSRGPQSLSGVLSQPNQYQAYNGSQYKIAAAGQGNTQKLQAIDAVLNNVKSGKLTDNTNGAYFYIHNPDQSITYDDTRPLYK